MGIGQHLVHAHEGLPTVKHKNMSLKRKPIIKLQFKYWLYSDGGQQFYRKHARIYYNCTPGKTAFRSIWVNLIHPVYF